MSEVSFDPFDAEFQRNPYPKLAELRERDPVHRSPLGFWVLTRYADIETALKERSLATEWGALTRSGIEGGPLNELKNAWLFTIDPPDHTRIRKLVHKAFTPRRIAEIRPAVNALISKLLDLPTGSQVDIVNDVAFPIPITVICDMLGIPGGDHDKMRRLTEEFIVAFEPVPPTGGMEQAEKAAGELISYADELIDLRRDEPTDDLMSALIHAEEDGDQLTRIELIGNIALLVGAGFETTTNLIGSLTWLLLTHPEQLQTLRDQPDLMGQAVWEALRCESPAQFTGRITTEPLEIAGAEIPEGENVLMIFSAANRDPSVYPNPDVFDITVKRDQPLAFGAGIHFCVGASLARLEAEEALIHLLDREPILLDAEPTWRPGFAFRGLETLPVSLK